MPGESEKNGQVPQLQVQNEDNETVLIQNGAPKKVETEKTENESSQIADNQKCELKKVEMEKCDTESSELEENQICELKKEDKKDTPNISINDQEKEVEKVEVEDEQTEAEQCELNQGEFENQLVSHAPENIQTSIGLLNQVETEEVEPVCPLRTTQVEEPKIESENQHSEKQTFASETENIEQCELKKVDHDEDMPSCPVTSTTRIDEIKEDLVTNGHQNQDVAQNENPKKVSMFTTLDSDAIKAAYEDVRSDNSETQWAVFKFQGSRIALSATGSEFEKFREQFTENERGFGYIRIQTGDEMSKRQKFLFITWVGPGVSVIQRAKMSTDKSLIKNIVSNFAVELQLENESDFDMKHFVTELNKAGGANYGTGIRDI